MVTVRPQHAFEITVYSIFIWLASESEYFVPFVGKITPYKFSASDITIEKKSVFGKYLDGNMLDR
jgi:hypothetical protein